MFTESKVTEIYCMADDFARNLQFNKKNIRLKIIHSRIAISPTV